MLWVEDNHRRKESLKRKKKRSTAKRKKEGKASERTVLCYHAKRVAIKISFIYYRGVAPEGGEALKSCVALHRVNQKLRLVLREGLLLRSSDGGFCLNHHSKHFRSVRDQD